MKKEYILEARRNWRIFRQSLSNESYHGTIDGNKGMLEAKELVTNLIILMIIVSILHYAIRRK